MQFFASIRILETLIISLALFGPSVSISFASQNKTTETDQQKILRLQSLTKLPLPILRDQIRNESNGTCEVRWPELASDEGIIVAQMDSQTKLYMIRCAHWAHNVGWAVYTTLEEPSHPDKMIANKVLFADYSAYQGLIARDLAYNIRWDEKQGKLLTQYFLNGNDFCGTKAMYVWSGAHQTFILQELRKQDNCKPPGSPWEVFYKVKSETSESLSFSWSSWLKKLKLQDYRIQ